MAIFQVWMDEFFLMLFIIHLKPWINNNNNDTKPKHLNTQALNMETYLVRMTNICRDFYRWLMQPTDKCLSFCSGTAQFRQQIVEIENYEQRLQSQVKFWILTMSTNIFDFLRY